MTLVSARTLGAVILFAASLTAPTVHAQSVTLVAPAVNDNNCMNTSFGSTSFLNFSWSLTAGFNDFASLPAQSPTCVSTWGPGYGQLASAFWGSGVNASAASSDVIQLRATAVDPTQLVSLSSLQLGEWSRGISTLSVRVYDLDGLEIFSQDQDGGNAITNTFTPNVSAVGGLILQYGEDPWYVGANNISFSVSPTTTVPEPATLTLLGLGLVGLAASRRRSARAA